MAAAVKINVSIAQPFVVAGTPFSLTTTVENAHEDDIEILEFLYHIPYQVQWINDIGYSDAYNKLRDNPWYKKLISSSVWRKTAHAPGEVMTYANIENPGSTLVTVLPGESISYSFKAIKWAATIVIQRGIRFWQLLVHIM